MIISTARWTWWSENNLTPLRTADAVLMGLRERRSFYRDLVIVHACMHASIHSFSSKSHNIYQISLGRMKLWMWERGTASSPALWRRRRIWRRRSWTWEAPPQLTSPPKNPLSETWVNLILLPPPSSLLQLPTSNLAQSKMAGRSIESWKSESWSPTYISTWPKKNQLYITITHFDL